MTLTSIAALGTVVATGAVLYSADGQPVVAVVTDQVFYRDLNSSSSDGPDVQVLEQALADLGYGSGLSVDETFTSATGAAVKQWESDLGRDEPDRTVSLGDLVGVSARGTVARQRVTPGDTVGDGSDILDIARGDREVVLDVAADATSHWAVETAVSVAWPDGGSHTGMVISVGTDVAADGTVEVVVSPDGGSDGLATGAAAEVTTLVESRRGVLTIPVSALLAGPDGTPAVRMVGGGAVNVGYGLVVDGLVEITSGLTDGQVVELPGTV